VALPDKSTALFPLPQALPIHFTVLEEKFVGRTVYSGKLISVSASGAAIGSELSLAPLSNLKIEVNQVAGANPAGEIYAKVTDKAPAGSDQTCIRFTSVSPELKVWVQRIASGPAGAPVSSPARASAQPTGTTGL
jgi:hypothetical protein